MTFFITAAGTTLLQSVIANSAALQFVDVQYGDGQASSENPTALAHLCATSTVANVTRSGDVLHVKTVLSNASFLESFAMTEMGVTAKEAGSTADPVLFAYMAIPSEDATRLSADPGIASEFEMDILLYIGDDSAFDIALDQSLVYATQAELQALEDRVDAESIRNVNVSASTLEAGSSATVSKVVDQTGAVTFLFGIPRGADGFSPTVTITAIEGGHRLTITTQDGTQTCDVMDGVSEIDTALSSSSTNPVQNKVIYAALQEMATGGSLYSLITGADAIAAEDVADEDLLPLVDVSSASTKKVTVGDLKTIFSQDSGGGSSGGGTACFQSPMFTDYVWRRRTITPSVVVGERLPTVMEYTENGVHDPWNYNPVYYANAGSGTITYNGVTINYAIPHNALSCKIRAGNSVVFTPYQKSVYHWKRYNALQSYRVASTDSAPHIVFSKEQYANVIVSYDSTTGEYITESRLVSWWNYCTIAYGGTPNALNDNFIISDVTDTEIIAKLRAIKGKYWKWIPKDGTPLSSYNVLTTPPTVAWSNIYYTPAASADATISKNSGADSYAEVEGYLVTVGNITHGTEYTNVTSLNQDAFPDKQYQGSYYYEYVGQTEETDYQASIENPTTITITYEEYHGFEGVDSSVVANKIKTLKGKYWEFESHVKLPDRYGQYSDEPVYQGGIYYSPPDAAPGSGDYIVDFVGSGSGFAHYGAIEHYQVKVSSARDTWDEYLSSSNLESYPHSGYREEVDADNQTVVYEYEFLNSAFNRIFDIDVDTNIYVDGDENNG